MDIMPDLDLIDREYAYDGELGALYSQAQTTFRVWSPMAERAVLKLYLSARANTPHSTLEMSRDGGVWEVAVPATYMECITPTNSPSAALPGKL